MAKLPEDVRERVARGGGTTCWLCGLEVEPGADWTWFMGKPAHVDCAWREESV